MTVKHPNLVAVIVAQIFTIKHNPSQFPALVSSDTGLRRKKRLSKYTTFSTDIYIYDIESFNNVTAKYKNDYGSTGVKTKQFLNDGLD